MSNSGWADGFVLGALDACGGILRLAAAAQPRFLAGMTIDERLRPTFVRR